MDGIAVGIAGIAATFLGSGIAVAFSYGAIKQKVSDMSDQIRLMGEGFNSRVDNFEKSINSRVDNLDKNVTDRIGRLEDKIDNHH